MNMKHNCTPYLLILLLLAFAAASNEGLAIEKPVKVFILAGQSNMQGHAQVRTLPHLGLSANSAPLLAKILDSDGDAKTHENVWITYLSSGGIKSGPLSTGFGANDEKIGPELMFGIAMSEQLGPEEKFLIVKAAWGGKSVHTDFRSPSAGPYEFTRQQLDNFEKRGNDIEKLKQEKLAATGKFYRLMIDHVKESLTKCKSQFSSGDATEFELAGFVWFQGWNDMVDGGVYPNRNQPGGYDSYTKNLAHMIRDVRKELSAPDLPFVIGVMGVGGPTAEYGKDAQRYKSTHQNFRDAMAAVANQPEFIGNVFNVFTENCWDQELAGLSKRMSKIDGQIRKLRKEGELSKDEIANKRSELLDAEFDPDELNILQTGKSNAEFHYLGSSKIMACIGKAFAETLIKNSK